MAQRVVQAQSDMVEKARPVSGSAKIQMSKVAGPLGRPLGRLFKYASIRLVVLYLMVVVAVYLTILIANMGGYVDEIVRTNIDLALAGMVRGGWLRDVPVEEKFEIIDQTREAMAEAQGLNEPFLLRSFRWLRQGLLLDWGESQGSRVMIRGRDSADVRDLIRENLPRTLLLFGTANLVLFFVTLFLALYLTRKYGGWLDRLMVALSPLGAAPAWAWGIILNVFFLRALGFLSTGGTLDSWPTEFTAAYIPILLKHMILPFLAIFASGFFIGVYTWRAYFLLDASGDHVEMAKAKGLPDRMIERSYILRPGLPTVLTSFALLLVVLWQEVIALEYFFNVAGIGRLFYVAIRSIDMPVILGLVVSFAYLLAITVFVLDIAYALVDPRVRVGNNGQTVRTASSVISRPKASRLPSISIFANRRSLISQQSTMNRSLRRERKRTSPIQWGRNALFGLRDTLRKMGHGLKSALLEIAPYPSAALGLAVIMALICTSIATVIVLPYDEAVGLWRGDDFVWYQNPLKAMPEWSNSLRKDKLPSTIVLDSRNSAPNPGNQDAARASVVKTAQPSSGGVTEVLLSYTFDYPYGGFPQDIALRLEAQYEAKKPLLTLTWLTPDGREYDLGSTSITSAYTYHLAMDQRLQRKLDTKRPQEALFADPAAEDIRPLQGTYELQVSAMLFEKEADLDAEFVLYGQVYGLAGTDHQRRDMMVGLLWGMPVALAFGLLAAVLTSITTIVIAAAGVWYGGWVDSLVQRVTEVNLILPFLPISIMIYTLYSKSFLVIIGVTVLLSIFGSGIKNYRAMFLQLKDAPYIEAARAYGASDKRIVLRYLVPRIGAVMIPQLVILVPSYVFLEATLAFLQVSDPLLPTWGKLIAEALGHSAYAGDYHLVLEPAFLLMLTGFAFAMVGVALERIFDPRLRKM